jgi:predicted N-acetyltransferase YhbS
MYAQIEIPLTVSHPSATVIRPETAADVADIDALHEHAFGPGRFARTASRLRERVAADPELSLVATVGGRFAGSIRLTPIFIGDTPALLLGPLAVDPGHGRRGLGKALVRTSLARAAERGHAMVLLVGDAAYYGPLGFHAVSPEKVRLPGPADPKRVLLAELVPGAAAAAAGLVRDGRG